MFSETSVIGWLLIIAGIAAIVMPIWYIVVMRYPCNPNEWEKTPDGKVHKIFPASDEVFSRESNEPKRGIGIFFRF